MSTTRNLRLARGLKVALDVIFVLLCVVSVFLLLAMLAAVLIGDRGAFVATASVPVILGTGEEPQIKVSFTDPPGDTIQSIFIDEAQGRLWLETRNPVMAVASYAAKLVGAAGLAYIIYLVRAVLKAVLDGDPFTEKNVRRIRSIGRAVLVFGILHTVAQYAAATVILNRLPAALPAFSAGPTFDSKVVLDALFILLLAHIWSYGLELERDRQLTV